MPAKAYEIITIAKIIKWIKKDYKDFDAYKFGIIDDKGNLVKHPKTEREKDAYNIFVRFVLNLKRLFDRIPFMKSKLASALLMYNLLKEFAEDENKIVELLFEGSSVATTLASHSPSDGRAVAQNSFAKDFDSMMKILYVSPETYKKLKKKLNNVNLKDEFPNLYKTLKNENRFVIIKSKGTPEGILIQPI